MISQTLRRRWPSVEECPDGLLQIEGPICRLMVKTHMTGQFVKAPEHREGIGFTGRTLNRLIVLAMWATHTEVSLMNILEQLEGNYDAAQALWKRYDENLKQFRASVKNDVVSLEAAARKTTDAVQKMSAAYGHVVAQLNSGEMKQAVENAERLAAAMAALAGMKPHRLTMDVVDRSEGDVG